MMMSPDTDRIRYPAAALLNLLPADAAVGTLGAPVPAVRGGIVSRRALFERLGRAGRVTQVSEPAGSGKTFLLRSWISAAGLAESTYLPTNLSAPEIARELSVSVNTVRTHIRHVCGKLDAHGRTEAVARARALGLLAPSSHAR